ncbi:MAG TPA: MFS transporter [Actinomycetes bacterium]|jgi:hypothetical protein|nr:MFS transporter [Actinomycetes bacterium]
MTPPAGTPEARPPGSQTRAASWRWRAFRRLLETQAAHAAGDVLVAVALADTVFFSVPLGEARAKVALYLALTMAPFAVLSPLVGPWLDRRAGSYRVAIVAAMAGRVVLAVLLSSRVQQLALYPLAFGLLVLSRVHGVSRCALVPEARPPDRSLMWANGRVAVISVGAGAAASGPALALNHWVGTGATLWTAAVVFAAGVLAATGLPNGEGEGEARPRERIRRYQELLTPRLLAGGIAMATLRSAVGFATFLLAFLLRADGQGGKGLAITVAAAAAGGFAGSVTAPALRAVLREPVQLLASLALTVVAAVWAAFGFGLLRAGVVAALVGFSAGAGRLAFDSLVQHEAPDHVRARTFARYETIFQLCWVAAAAVATAVPFGPAPGLWALAWICLGGLALSAWGLLHSAGRAPAPPRLALSDRLRPLSGRLRPARAPQAPGQRPGQGVPNQGDEAGAGEAPEADLGVSERSSRRPW